MFRDWTGRAGLTRRRLDARALASVNEVLASHGAGRGRAGFECRGPDSEFVTGVPPMQPEAKGPRPFTHLQASSPEHAEVLYWAIEGKDGTSVTRLYTAPHTEMPLSDPQANSPMFKVLKVLLLLLLITGMVWLSTLWRWQTQGIDPDGLDVLLYLVLLPLALTATLLAALWMIQKIRKTLNAPALAAKSNEKAATDKLASG